MREQIKTRLNELRREFETGQTELQQLQLREAHLREMMVRISGAIQVLEELLAQPEGEPESQAKPAQVLPSTAQAPQRVQRSVAEPR